MREILFRGKRIDNGEWLYGYYGFDDNKPLIAINKENGINGYFVYPDTIGQCAGDLTDKNGNKIFEGDILRVKQRGETGVIICVVYFGEYIDADNVFDDYRCIGFYIKTVDGCCTFGTLLNSDFEIEVIGNIHDNSELLEVER